MRASRLLVPALLLAVLFALPAPAADAPTKKELLTSQNNLKQLALAIISYADANNGSLPTNITDKEGKELLSWRVAILPYLEQDPLYKQFKLDEPWDSAGNKKLIEKMPKVYAPVRVQAKAGETYYQVFYGEGAIFGPKLQPKFPTSITDGTSETALVVEAGEPVIWSKPADLLFFAKRPLLQLGGLFDGEFNVALCDGSVMRIKKDFDEAEMKKFITPAGAEIIDFDKLKK